MENLMDLLPMPGTAEAAAATRAASVRALPASAAEAPRPSVSDEVGQALPTGDEQAQLGTTVNVLAVASPAIVEHTESFAASVAQISGNSSFDLKVVATGKGELAYF